MLKKDWLPHGPARAMILRLMSIPPVLSDLLATSIYPFLCVKVCRLIHCSRNQHSSRSSHCSGGSTQRQEVHGQEQEQEQNKEQNKEQQQLHHHQPLQQQSLQRQPLQQQQPPHVLTPAGS